ncbi:MAG: hypothetical protein NTY77_06040 [Elusimicrobia bacterium]|nr:hypothetical protein [Elusimicrobiota bacterium]
MPTIAIVDDRPENRESLQNLIEPKLLPGWDCRPLHPLENLSDYLSLLVDKEKDIVAIVLDEKLHERGSTEKKNVTYRGTDLAKFLRKRLPEFPIYLITSFQEELKTDEGLFEELFPRNIFTKNPGVHVKRMIRAGLRFSRNFQKELNELSAVATRIAQGNHTVTDLRRATAIREQLGIAFPAGEMADRTEWLNQLNSSIDGLRNLSSQINAALKRSRRHKQA